MISRLSVSPISKHTKDVSQGSVFPDVQHTHKPRSQGSVFPPFQNIQKTRVRAQCFPLYNTHTHTSHDLKTQCFPLYNTHKPWSQDSVLPPLQHIHKPWSQGSVLPPLQHIHKPWSQDSVFPHVSKYQRREIRLSFSPFTTHTKDMNQGSALSHFNTCKRHDIRAHCYP